MYRREYLGAAGLALATGLAGCSSTIGGETPDGSDPDGPGGGSTPTPEGRDWLASFRAALEAEGLEASVGGVEDGIVDLEWVAAATDDETVHAELGTVADAFATELEAGWDVEWLEGWLLESADGEAFAVATLHRGRTMSWAAGDLSDEAFLEESLDRL